MGVTPNISVRRHKIPSAAKTLISYEEYLPLTSAIRADVMLVHGLASSGQQFAEDAVYFAERGFRVLVPDLRGHGWSDVSKENLEPSDFSIPIMAQDLIAILDHAKAPSVHWVGNSLGGILALQLLGTPHKERLENLVLFGTCFSMDLPSQVTLALRVAFLPGASATAWITARTTTASARGRKSIAAAIKQLNVDAAAAIASHVRNYDFTANALAYDCPTLLLWGGKDHAVNLRLRKDIEKFSDRPNFRRIDLPQGGHCANFDMPEAFRTALEQHWDQRL